MSIRLFLAVISAASVPLLSSTEAAGDTICKTTTGALVLRHNCRKGESRVDLSRFGVVGQPGATGATGTPGAEGALRVYGDGSAGALDVEQNSGLGGFGSDDTNTQYTSITIKPGTTFGVPSGTVLRSTGNCDIEGAIRVDTFALGGVRGGTSDGNLVSPGGQPAGTGFVGGPPQVGAIGSNGDVLEGGTSCEPNPNLNGLLLPGSNGGSGGAGGNSFLTAGGRGGGTFVIICEGDLTFGVGSSVHVDGTAPAGAFGTGGAGGGAGGLIVAGSKKSITTLPGSLFSARGGAGENSNTDTAAGGGGSGGKVHFIAPTLTLNGSLNVSGGAAGIAITQITSTIAMGGGAGGCSANIGGNGGTIPIGRPVSPGPAMFGNDGDQTATLADPTTLFW
jgi:hypothetical protein